MTEAAASTEQPVTVPPRAAETPGGGLWGGRPKLRLTSEFDSESSVFFHKASCKLLRDGLAKLKLSFYHNPSSSSSEGQLVSDPQVSLVTKLFSLHYHLHHRTPLLTASLPLGPKLRLSASHNLQDNQGDLSVLANLSGDPGYSLQLSSPLPPVAALPRASLKFPVGEIAFEEKEYEEEEEEEIAKPPALSLSGSLKSPVLDGLFTAQFRDDDFHLRYSYKDAAVTFTPSISLPSNAASFAFKRRLSPSNKLSYWYNFDVNTWSAVYKHTYGKDFTFKAGYDSDVRLGWASIWVGDEDGKAKTAPMKMKVQLMLQVPQDDIRSAALMFRVKKRWDV